MTRRDFLVGSAATLLLPLRLNASPRQALKFAIIADVHHGLAPDAVSRLTAFVEEVAARKDLDLVIQMGDFCHAGKDAEEFIGIWNSITQPKLHVLGNHDMDKVDKATAMKFWKMDRAYGSYPFGEVRIVVLDLNHLKKDGKLVPYANGNYFANGVTQNWADPEQLDWLAAELRKGKKPTILLSHQPLGLGASGQPLPPEQTEVLKVIQAAARANPAGAVAACLCGHLHVDRLENQQGMPCYCVNSASYFWSGGMHAYTKPLFAFMELTTDGKLKIEGRRGEFAKAPPEDSAGVVGRSPSIGDRAFQTWRAPAKFGEGSLSSTR